PGRRTEGVLTRRLDLKVFAPTVLVSLPLVGACLWTVLYLNRLHIDVSRELSENVQSTQAAATLEGTTNELGSLLRRPNLHQDEWDRQVEVQNRAAGARLEEVRDLANREREKALVPQLATGLDHYLAGWRCRGPLAACAGGLCIPVQDAALAGQLE